MRWRFALYLPPSNHDWERGAAFAAPPRYLFSSVIGSLIGRLERNSLLGSSRSYRALGPPEMQPDHPRRRVLPCFLPELFNFGRFPVIPRVSRVLRHDDSFQPHWALENVKAKLDAVSRNRLGSRVTEESDTAF